MVAHRIAPDQGGDDRPVAAQGVDAGGERAEQDAGQAATPVGEDGARLSGGQRRRVALARAFLLDRPIVILDEPTAHLDLRTAGEVREAIVRHCRGRTALLVTHDRELAALADQVVALERGRTLPAGVRR